MDKKNVEAIYPLSPVQQGMFFESISAPSSGVHIEQSVRTLRGGLSVVNFERAWQAEVERHPMLRTCFVWKDQAEPLQVVLRKVKLPFLFVDLCALSTVDQDEQLEAYLTQDRRQGFKLAQGPLLRLALFQMGEQEYRFIWTRHHILMDGWCTYLIIQEVLLLYQSLSQGETLALKSPRPYRDYIAWLKRQDLSEAERFWRKTLRGFTCPTPLGNPGKPRSLGEQETRHETLIDHVPTAITLGLRSLTGQHSVTLNTCIQSAWALLLSHYSQNNDVVFGITVSGRSIDLPGIEDMVGLCINTLPVRARLNPQAKLLAWLAEIQAYNLDLRQYEYSPGGLVHQWSELPGTARLFESLLVVENYPVNVASPLSSSSSLNISISHTRAEGAQTKFPLTLLVLPGTGLQLRLIYDKLRFDAHDMQHVLTHFQLLLQTIVAHPDQHLSAFQQLLPSDQIPVYRLFDEHTQIERRTAYQAPRTPLEEVLAHVWSDVLGIEQVGIHDNFFSFGGHSLLATQVMSQLRIILQAELPIRLLFDAPTIAAFAQLITTRNTYAHGYAAYATDWLKQRKAEQLLHQLDSLSDDEVDQALHELLLKEKGQR